MAKKQRFNPDYLAAAAAAASSEAASTASYIADLAGELEKLADENGIDALADTLRAARIEALRFSALKVA
ncbi:hypothetical protein [Hyphococcus luteus]|uniref:Uncharacterized protein n=1 Tax=Hyphococcus luteus TaxID=2058213 RepID=A0A2S7JZP9_9PROT|nr:hypothetical protein [Marinicaulis flavus]PQA85733.1 hypothetical protein CW354_22675 [Marinicaulis flavus]